MEELEKLNSHPGIATNAMCTFLTINTAGLQLIPATVIGIMASAGSREPTAIIGTTVAATFTALIIGIATVKTLEKLRLFSVERQRKS
jgi:spore maturation protein A